MLLRELWLGSERAYACRISKQVFRRKAVRRQRRRREQHCTCVRDHPKQTRNSVPAGTSIRQRRKIYHNSEAARLYRAAGFAALLE